LKPEEVLAGIDVFADATIVGELAGGPASDSYLIERDAEKFVLRIDTFITAALGLDRAAEIEVLAFVSQKDLGPRLEFVDLEQGIVVTRYVEGRVWTESDLHDADRIRKLAALLRCLHLPARTGQPINLQFKVDNYARIIGTSDGRELAKDTRQLLLVLEDPSVPQCLCHNDLICANIIEEQELILIDWEYAAIGDPVFDLATLAEHHQFDQDQVDVLLSAYFGEVRSADALSLNRYRLLYNYLLILWLASVEQLCGISEEQNTLLQRARKQLNDREPL